MLEQPLFWGAVLTAIVMAGVFLSRSAPTPVEAAGKGPEARDRQAARGMPDDLPDAQPNAARRPELGQIRSWGYQLQNLDMERAANCPFDLLVIDHTHDGTDDTRLTRAEVMRLQRKADGRRRLVLAYASIGEAEDYRAYWQASWSHAKPMWLLAENADWPGNYSVRFWDPGWQRLMVGHDDAYLDRILTQGFDGIYLDKCDVYEDLQRLDKRLAATRTDIEGDMTAFVGKIARHLKAKKPDFLIVMQNAEGLTVRAELLSAIDGIAKEEMVYGVDAPSKRNSADDIAYSKACLDRAKHAGKPVFVVEYLAAPSKIALASELVANYGYVLYVAPKDRELDALNYDAPTA